MPRLLLALDVSTPTGWAFGPVGEGLRPTLSGVMRFGTESGCEEDAWFSALAWLTLQIGDLKPNVVAIVAAPDSANPTEELLGLQAVLRTVVRAKLPSIARKIHVKDAREFFVGHRNLPGAEARTRTKRRCVDLGWLAGEAATHARSDACAVWAKAAADLDPAFAASFRKSINPEGRS
jgi:hypothetical protein